LFVHTPSAFTHSHAIRTKPDKNENNLFSCCVVKVQKEQNHGCTSSNPSPVDAPWAEEDEEEEANVEFEEVSDMTRFNLTKT
jgi:hypothetical protein